MSDGRIDRWYPLLHPDTGEYRSAPDLRRWIIWCRGAVEKLEDSRALSIWRDAMQPHLATIRAIRPEAASLIATLIDDRLAALTAPAEEAAT